MNRKCEEEKKNRIPGLLAAVLWIALILFLGVGVEILCQFRVRRLPKEQQGLVYLNPDEVNASGGVTRNGDVFEKPNGLEGELTFSLGGRYVEKLQYDVQVYGMFQATLVVDQLDIYGQPERVVIQDYNSATLSSSVVNIGHYVNQVTIRLPQIVYAPLAQEVVISSRYEAEPMRITGIAVKNDTGWNLRRMIFVWLFAALAVLFICLRDVFGRRPEAGFAMAALSIGVLMIAIMPVHRVSWDEEIHFERAYAISLLPGHEFNDTVPGNLMQAGVMTWYQNIPDSLEEERQQEAYFDYYFANPERYTNRYISLDMQYSPSYLLSGLTLKITRKLGLPFSFMIRAGRFANLFFYVLVMGFIIRILPAWKRIMAMIGLMPTTLFQACTFSYDTYLTLGCFLIAAVSLREAMTPKVPVRVMPILAAILLGMAGILNKAVYAPLFLLFWLIPRKEGESRALFWLIRLTSLAAMLYCVSTFVGPVAGGADISDPRGGEVSMLTQMDIVLGKPVHYSIVLLNNIWKSLPGFLGGDTTFGGLGYIPNRAPVSWLIVVALLVVMTDTNTDVPAAAAFPERGLGVFRKLWIFLISGMCVALVFTSMYLAFTEVGKLQIAGVQGRYMIPLLFPFYLIFNPMGFLKAVEEKKAVYTMSVFLIMTAVEGVSVWTTLMTRFAV